MLTHKRWIVLAPLSACLVLFFSCATYNPGPADEMPFREREQTQVERNVRVTAAVLSADETQAYFGLPLYKRGIQPVWLEIENKNPHPVWFLPYATDPDYFPPLEVAYMHHITFKAKVNQAMDRNLYDSAMGFQIPPGAKRSGFVFTHRQLGTKIFNVELIGKGHALWLFTFFVNVPGLPIDYQQVDWAKLYSDKEIIDFDEQGLRRVLEQLPCCASDEKGLKKGDPINLVIVGRGRDALYALIRSGWDETRAISGAKSESKATLGKIQKYRPVEPQYLYNRRQDAAFSKTRKGINSRNQIRLWLSPYRLKGLPIFVGQIQRNIRTASQTATHRIDPDVDEARTYLLQDLWYSQGLQKRAYVKGVGQVPISTPRRNYKGATYYTDGLRVVLWLSSQPVPFTEIDFVDWERPSIR